MAYEAGLYCTTIVVPPANYNPAEGIPSVEDVFNEVAKKYHDLPLRLASGALPDINKISDVDISLLYDPARASALFTQIVKVKQSHDHTIYSLGGYPREVNIFVTLDEKLANRAIIHRENELYINAMWPDITKAAREYKRLGVTTELSYAYVIGFDDMDPYEALLDRDIINAAVKRMEKRIIENILC